MIGEYEVCDVTVYESMRLRPSTPRRENSVLKSIHFGKRFRMYAFRIKLKRRLRVDGRCKRIRMYAFTDVNVYVWTGP